MGVYGGCQHAPPTYADVGLCNVVPRKVGKFLNFELQNTSALDSKITLNRCEHSVALSARIIAKFNF